MFVADRLVLTFCLLHILYIREKILLLAWSMKELGVITVLTDSEEFPFSAYRLVEDALNLLSGVANRFRFQVNHGAALFCFRFGLVDSSSKYDVISYSKEAPQGALGYI